MTLVEFVNDALSRVFFALRAGRCLPAMRLLLEDGSIWTVTTVDYARNTAHGFSGNGGHPGEKATPEKFRVVPIEAGRVLVLIDHARPSLCGDDVIPYKVMRVMGVAIRPTIRSPEHRMSVVQDCVF